MLPDRCPVYLSVCDVGVLWPNGWMDEDETWHEGMAVATFEATEAAASVVFMTLASVKNNYFDQLNFKYESRESRLYCRNS